MSLELHLPSLITHLSRSSSAWRSVSTDGAQRVSALGSVLVTLQSHRLSLAPTPAPGQLGELVQQGTLDLNWLRSSVARLSRILNGANDYLVQLQSARNRPLLTWSLNADQWITIVGDVVEGMRKDLDDKRQVVTEIENAIQGKGVHVERMEVLAALWLEQPALKESIVQLPQAVLDAETEAQRIARRSRPLQQGERETPKKQQSLSPAMALLLGD